MDPELPEFPDEIEMLKSLNRIRNRNLDNYDKIYPTKTISHGYDKDNFNVETIRAIFFIKLMPFLTSAFQTIDTSIRCPKNVHDFFKKEVFLANVN